MDIMCGIDASNKSLVCAIGAGKEAATIETYPNTKEGRKSLYSALKARKRAAKAEKILTAYEACGLGYGMWEEMKAAGIDCRILSPGQMKKSIRDKKLKTDAADTEAIYREIRAYVLAGNPLPEVWVKPKSIREDLEAVRGRIDLGADIGRIKTRIRALLKKHDVEVPEGERLWTEAGRTIIREAPMAMSVQVMVLGLLRRLEYLEEEKAILDRYLKGLAATPKYSAVISALLQINGVGILTATAFALEIGDMERFHNRRQIASYLGLVPMSYETGDANDRKGHITRTGSARLRKLLNQAAWVWAGARGPGMQIYQSILAKNPKKNKIAIVAVMRRLAIEMWRKGLGAQRATKATAASAA